MDTAFLDFFIARWAKYFPGADLPIGYFYTGGFFTFNQELCCPTFRQAGHKLNP